MSRTISTIGIVGVGVMGTGIAQIAAAAGLTVKLYDAREGAAAAAVEALHVTFDKLVARGKIEPGVASLAMSRLAPENDIAGLADCDLVVEAIVEKLEAKQQLFAELETVVAQDALLATNTSSLSVTAIAVSCSHPERVAGFHFFNPVPLMRVVEIIPGFATSIDTTNTLVELARRIGHRGVVARDTPGFIINHAGRAYGTEALRLAEEGVASFAAIDAILRDAGGFRMGPFELFDLTGLDISHPATRAIFDQFFSDPRYRPSYLAEQRVAARQFGRKTGAGFYNYGGAEGGGAPQAEQREALQEIPPLWLSRSSEFDLDELKAVIEACGGLIDGADSPGEGSLILLAPLGDDATEAAVREKVDPVRSVAIDLLNGLRGRRTLMGTPATDPKMLAAAAQLFAKDGVEVTVIGDSMGFVVQRVLAAIINLACEIAQQRIASPADIDDAVRLGLGYPQGPLSWGDSLGPRRILKIISRMHALSGDPRYRPSPWLRRRAQLGLSLMQEE
jgi:3-hydroxybutyryl-CoA dehydrogenase